MSLTPFQTRYGQPVTVPNIEPSELIARQLTRVSIRIFDNVPLPDGMLELLLASAQSSPSSGMLQTWSVIALTNTEAKLKLLSDPYMYKVIGNIDSYNYNAINTCAVFLIWLADLHKIDVILKNSKCEENIENQIDLAEYHLKAIIDATIAAQTFYMSAESMGLAGTYIGAIRQLPIDSFIKNFNLPKYTFPLFGMAIGYPGTYTGVKPRLPADLMLHHSTYKEMNGIEDLGEYQEKHKKLFHNSQSITFSERVIERLSPSWSKSSIGNALKKMGFTFK